MLVANHSKLKKPAAWNTDVPEWGLYSSLIISSVVRYLWLAAASRCRWLAASLPLWHVSPRPCRWPRVLETTALPVAPRCRHGSLTSRSDFCTNNKKPITHTRARSAFRPHHSTTYVPQPFYGPVSGTTTILRPCFQHHPGEPVPEENFWISWCKGRLTETDTPTIRLDATPSGLTSAYIHHPPIFFTGPDALPAAQPTASKHWRQLAHSD